MSTVLVVAAHPDDELLGSGATLAGHARAGDEVHALILADGATARYADGMADVLAHSAGRAAEALGLTSVRLLALPDQRLETLPMIEVVGQVETVVDELCPELVYAHFPGDANTDHAVAARAVWTACRPYVLPRLRRFAVFETPSSTEWGWPFDGCAFRPNSFVDVSATIEQKLEAMTCYDSELRDYPHPRSLRALRERAAYWGSQVGRDAVEPFQLLREIR